MAELFSGVWGYIEPYLDILRLVVTIIVSFIVFSIILKIIKKYLLQKVKTKRQLSNVMVFLDLLKYLFIFFVVIIVIFSYYNRWGELGFIAGLMTIALGWALQKPISGVVAWLIIVVRQPFRIGDRVVISNIKGDITNLSLTHIFLNEVGGTIEGEEQSGRTVMIPMSNIFDHEIINFTQHDEFILDEVVTAITFESNLEKAENIMLTAVGKVMKSYWERFPKKITREPHIRLTFKDSGIDVTVRYYTLATKRNKISTDIRREIYRSIRGAEDVEFAYPHAEVLFREKKGA
jgi:small-conductance mechanosensitive channel